MKLTDVTFVRTRHHYVPYDDFFRLSELSGYDTCYVDEIDPYDTSKVWIVTPLNGEWIGGWPDAKARIIHFELEWRTDWHAEIDTPPGIAETWASDRAYAEKIGARYVLLGGHKGLTDIDFEQGILPKSNHYDLVFMSYLDPSRRKHIYNEFTLAGIAIAPNGWGIERFWALAKSRCMVHVHQFDNIPYIAPLRWCIAAAYSLPLISESVVDRGAFGYGHFMTADYEHLVPFTLQWLRPENANVLADYGRALHGFLCREYTFRACVEAAL